MRRTGRFPALLTITSPWLAMVASCDSSETPRTHTTVEVRDSSGVELITNSGPDIRLQSREVVRVGVLEGDPNFQFHRGRAIAVDSGGGFWVTDSNESVRHYGPRGEFLESIGSRGDGPGEARYYSGVWASDHAVLVFGDPMKLQLFAPEGTLIGERSARADDSFFWPIGFMGDRVLFQGRSMVERQTGLYRSPTPLLAGDATGGPYQLLTEFPGELRNGEEGYRGSTFLGDPSFAVDRRGGFYRSDPVEYRIESYSPEGTLLRVLLREVPARAFDVSWRDQLEDGLRAEFQQSVGALGQERVAAEIERAMDVAWPSDPPDHLPFIEGDRVGGLLVSRDGYLWVRRADLHPRPGMKAAQHHVGTVPWAWQPEWRAPTFFDLFDPSGTYIGSVELPAEFTPMDVTRDRVYGTIRDELDVEYVVAFQVITNGAA